jgi:60 kDa SS-A/Ro ribonucleoprotein
VRKSRIHPLNVLMATKTYAHGQPVRGNGAPWTPLPKIVDALDELFYLSFGNVEPTGLRRCIALDVSGSMSGSQSYSKRGYFSPGGFKDISGFPGLSPREAAAAMSLVSMKTGDPYEVVAFTAPGHPNYSHYTVLPQVFDGLSVLPLSPRQRLDDICARTEEIFPGATDLSLPMRYAKEMRREFDVFEVYTDNETNTRGQIHPSQALEQYRKSSGIDAKLVVIGLVANRFSIADPADPGMLDVAGFDTATPQLISAFAEGGF